MKESVSLMFHPCSSKMFIWCPVMARSMKSREEASRNSLGSVSLGCLSLFPALSQCCWCHCSVGGAHCSQEMDQSRSISLMSTQQMVGRKARLGCAWSGNWLCTSPSAGVAHWSAPLAMAISPLLLPLSVQTPGSIPPGGSVPWTALFSF